MQARLATPLQQDSIVDGEGIRTVLWFQGCKHNCKGCHNKETHSFDEGFLQNVEDIKEEIKYLKGQDGITLSGGDPLFQKEASLEIAKFCKKISLNVWCYTGFTFEELLEMSKTDKVMLELLQNIDVLVDGKFIEEERSLSLYFRGSSNQRIIDMRNSIKKNKAIEIEKYNKRIEQESLSCGKIEGMFI